jgi:hypothetical protein
MATLNQINVLNLSGLDTSKYTVWVAGYIAAAGPNFCILQSNGSFGAPGPAASAPFYKITPGLTQGLSISVPNVTNYGNNRLVFTITPASTQGIAYPINGYTAYPFPGIPGACPPGPYDIFEFGPNAEYDVSAVDSFGINLSFAVKGDPATYGVRSTVTRAQIGSAFSAFTQSDPYGKGFAQLLYSSPGGTGYPPLIAGQFSAIVSPKDWLAINPGASGLSGYWGDTVNAFFLDGNQLKFFLHAATVGYYAGTSDGGRYKLTGPGGLVIDIPKSDFLGNQGFVQAVRGQKSGESAQQYAAFNQIEAALFEAFSRGVALDGVVKKGNPMSETYSSNAWTNTAKWFTNHTNAYNNKPSVYDVYAKFFHYGTIGGQTIYSQNSSGKFAMAYGFSIDENPNVGSTSLLIPPNSWPATDNVPSKTPGDVGSQAVTLVVGPWGAS